MHNVSRCTFRMKSKPSVTKYSPHTEAVGNAYHIVNLCNIDTPMAPTPAFCILDNSFTIEGETDRSIPGGSLQPQKLGRIDVESNVVYKAESVLPPHLARYLPRHGFRLDSDFNLPPKVDA